MGEEIKCYWWRDTGPRTASENSRQEDLFLPFYLVPGHSVERYVNEGPLVMKSALTAEKAKSAKLVEALKYIREQCGGEYSWGDEYIVEVLKEYESEW